MYAVGPAHLPPGWQVEVLAEAPSTNAEASERAREGIAEGWVVLAERQTAGRGRLDRVWEAPPGSGLTFSVVLRPEVAPGRWPWLPLLAGVAVRSGLVALGYDVALKWPNDVLIRIDGDDRKVAGILVERVDTGSGPAAVVGVGINVTMSAEQLPVPEAGSLALARPEPPPEAREVLVAVLAALAEAYRDWTVVDGGQERLASSYAAACATVGRQVMVSQPGGGDLVGRAESIDASGRLVLGTTDGRLEAVGAGDVVHVRVT